MSDVEEFMEAFRELEDIEDAMSDMRKGVNFLWDAKYEALERRKCDATLRLIKALKAMVVS